ncbi:DNA-3-methyladenine glycosylase I [Sinobacterium caligoides]|uniref:DNA-3-methyladenine glycosylase I n=1 Tax=Sinobacterium caligoides TaxID=933926 RepID=A0A3N2DKT8_9GAMM|nr:DNA-3-methyladenine glycosylase I [Sinobacterium caligoides]ROR99954.1 DNA-3-methyladenine glycosylase I [Sinobacterium caligoides]
MESKPRCQWAGEDPLYQHYHDNEWGKPLHGDQALFEMLCLEGQQAGLSWITVLKKRAHYRQCFHHFDINKVAAMSDEDIEQNLLDKGLIRNRLKLYAIRQNARATLDLQQELGSLDDFLWSFVNHTPIINTPEDMASLPSKTTISDAMSKALKKRGFKFIGSTICYAFMQASGMVDDHVASCYLGKNNE